MRFVPAPPEVALTMMPVTIVPTVQAASTPPPATETGLPPEAPIAETGSLSVLEVFDTGTDYILIGAFSPPAPRPDEKGLYAVNDISLRDGNGQVIEDEEFPPDLDLTPYRSGITPGKSGR